MRTSGRLLSALLLASAGVACDDATDPAPPALAVTIVEPEVTPDLIELDPVRFLGDATAPDVGALPDDSLWWTVDGAPAGAGRRLVLRARAGAQTVTLHARYGADRADTAFRRITADPGGLGRLLWMTPLDTAGLTRYGAAVTWQNGLTLTTGGTLLASEQPAGSAALAVALDTAGQNLARQDVAAELLYHGTAAAALDDGTIRWSFGGRGIPEGTGPLVSLSSALTPVWTFYVQPGPYTSDRYHITGAVAVDAEGTAYFGSEEIGAVMYAVRADGSQKWRSVTQPGASNRVQTHTVLLGDSLAIAASRVDSIVAVATADGAVRWTVSRGDNISYCQLAPAVGADGTVYVPGSSSLTAISPAGTVRWRLADLAPTPGSPVVGTAGVYLGTADGVRSFTASGEPRGAFETRSLSGAAISLGAHDILYVLAADSLISYEASGTRRFATRIPNPGAADCQSVAGPVIGPDGTVYVRGYQGVYAVRDTAGPSPQAPWVTLQGNFHRTGRRATEQ